MRTALVLLAGLTVLVPAISYGSEAEHSSAEIEKSTEGRPNVHLDQLVFPKNIVGASGFEKYLRKVLKREANRVDWGAGHENHIEYRFYIERLEYTVDGHALRIRCEARGHLPGGQTAKSELTFGGDISKRTQLTQQVLEIVGRGVVSRLAQLERKRRGLN